MDGWRPALRIARRDALRHRGRSILVLVMIALPVLAVTAADIVYQTNAVDSVESLDRRLGSADARVGVDPGTQRVQQDFDPDEQSASMNGKGDAETRSIADVRRVLGRDVPAVERVEGGLRFDTERGVGSAEGTEIDLASPLTSGLFRLTAGRWPSGPGEVAVNAELASSGFDVGSELTVHDGATLEVVGTAESTSIRGYPIAVGAPGSLGLLRTEGQATWLIGGGGVSWDEVRALNTIGATVLSRAVVLDPPPTSELPSMIRQTGSVNDGILYAVLGLVVAMGLLEVVLLAGPAFAVGARRQQRTLALMSASGGTPRQARRVVLASGVVLGAAAAVLGVIIGVVVGWALLPVVQHYSDSFLGPFDYVPWHLGAVAGFGVLSAFLAAVVPAWIASRQDVVAVLAGRRGDRRPSLRSPLLGVVLLGLGIAGSVLGATGGSGGGDLTIAGSAVIAVLGMILLVPVVVSTLARFSRRLPLVARYAVRDAARHRTRTVPAVAAVAATVAGVVALGIGNASDAAEAEATYSPRMPIGQGSLTDFQSDGDFSTYEEVLRREAPQVGVTDVLAYDPPRDGAFSNVRVARPEAKGFDNLLTSYSPDFGSVLIGVGALDFVTPVDEADLEAARAMLADGGAVAFTSEPVTGDRLRFSGSIESPDGRQRLTPMELPAYFLQVQDEAPPALAVVPAGSLDATGLEAGSGGLLLDAADLSKDEEKALQEVLAGISDNVYLYVERGYQETNARLIALAILFALGAVLMLGGTLTATFLALSDARPDLATLAAVGAAPRMRRGVAAAYALVVGFVGAALGAAVGFIPGIAVTYPLTSTAWAPGQVDADGGALPSHFVDIPWTLVIGLVVVLPLLTALIVGLTARSRLPLVARLD